MIASDFPDVTASALRALVLYSVAEFQGGYVSAIRVTLNGTSFSVADDGRGHSPERAVAGTPYLEYIYTHFDYPFGVRETAPVQLQGLGMSLINALCSELKVTAQRREATLRLSFKNGVLLRKELLDASEQTGNTIVGAVSPMLQTNHSNIEQFHHWLLCVRDANPSLQIFFNGAMI